MLNVEKQAGIDWVAVEQTLTVPSSIESLEGSFRAELVGSVPSKAMYDRLVAEDSSKAVSAPMQITWMCYATFSNLGIQVLRIQRQLKAMCFRKVMTVADSQQKCQVFCRETQRCLEVGIRPAQPREASSWYVSAFLPCIRNPEWTDFMSQQKKKLLT